MILWQRFQAWLNYESDRSPRVFTQPTTMPNVYLKKLEALEAQVADVVLGRKVERWAKAHCGLIIQQIESKIQTLEEKMATHEELQPVIQGIGQHLDRFLAKQDQVLAELAETRTALEAQTNKYKAACDERDAALQREQAALQQRDEVKAELEKWDQMVQAAHSRAAGAVTNKTAA